MLIKIEYNDKKAFTDYAFTVFCKTEIGPLTFFVPWRNIGNFKNLEDAEEFALSRGKRVVYKFSVHNFKDPGLVELRNRIK